MTLDLDQLERLAAAATPGPWTHAVTPEGPEQAKAWIAECYDKGTPGPAHMVVVPYEGRPLADEALVVAITGNGPTSAANVAFIAAAREAIPALVAEVQQLRSSERAQAALANQAVGDRDAMRDKMESCEASVYGLMTERDQWRARCEAIELDLDAACAQLDDWEASKATVLAEQATVSRLYDAEMRAGIEARARLAEVSQERDSLAEAMKRQAAQCVVMRTHLEHAMRLITTYVGSAINSQFGEGAASNAMAGFKYALAPDAGRALLAEVEALRELVPLLASLRTPLNEGEIDAALAKLDSLRGAK